MVRSPTPFGLGQNGCWPSRGSQLPRALPSHLCFLITLVVPSLVFAAMGTTSCLTLPRIGKIENPSCSACGHSSKDTPHLILNCPAKDSLRRSFSSEFFHTTSGPNFGELHSFWGSMVSSCHLSLGRGQVTTRCFRYHYLRLLWEITAGQNRKLKRI